MKKGLRKATAILLVVLMMCGALVFAVPPENTLKASATSGYAQRMIDIALAEEGNSDGSKYGSSSGWCAFFIVWCARQAGIDSSVIKSTGWAAADDLGVEYRGRNASRTQGINYTPKPGDIIIYDWAYNTFESREPASNYGDHVGIVYNVDSSYVYSIEGNRGEPGIVKKVRTSLNDENIKGYGIPHYPDDDPTPFKPYDETDSLGNDFYAHIDVGPEHFVPTAVLSQKNIDANGNGVIEAATERKSAYYHKWHFKRTSDGKSFNIFDAVTGYAWQINEDTASAGKPVVLGPPDNPDSNNRQKWYLYKKKDFTEFYYFVPVTNSSVGAYAYDSSGNTLGNVVLRDLSETYDSSNKDKASYSFELVSTSFAPDIPTKEDRRDLGDDFYATIINTGNNRMVMNSPKLSEPHRIATAVEPDGSLKQIWHFVRDNDKYYTIRSAYSEATSSENDTELVNMENVPGCHVFLLPESTSENHKWYITETATYNNFYLSKYENCVLNREDSGLTLYSFENGVNCMQMAKYNPLSSNQRFTITKVDVPDELKDPDDPVAAPKLKLSVKYPGTDNGNPAKITITPQDSSEPIEKDLIHSKEDGGEITLHDLLKGEYNLHITKPGFLSYTKKKIDLQADTTLSDIVLFAGDITGDDKINAKDQAAMTATFGLSPTDERYNYVADFNEDGYINAKDRADIVANFGKSGTVVE